MAKYKVSFEDVLDNCETEEQAYEALLEYLSQVVRFEDVTAFNFQEVKNENT